MRTIAASANTKNKASFTPRTVGDLILHRPCLTLRPGDYVDVILPLLQNDNDGVAGVTDDEGRLVGLLTERQILRRVFLKALDPLAPSIPLRRYVQDMTVAQVMIESPETLDEAIDLEDAAGMMLRRGYRFMPVVSHAEPQRLLGIVDEREIALQLKNRLQEVKRSEEETKSLLAFMLHEPYGASLNLSQ